ncbi:hypothetical protein C922_01647 [Plasmodium inui San Antonio 1]|uniref:Uncharacterized protein n=1 Tax=Plasmodium inui San Antonio 1 TaxID=1237626 RepID=W7A8P0_9APIC|nr:hypothetical protein C922_01647 [Plasmodium inui San Antonio 1]EUD68035.1 hypothetical protein C922_01647 [Plasmodium inui San Antonio 1]
MRENDHFFAHEEQMNFGDGKRGRTGRGVVGMDKVLSTGGIHTEEIMTEEVLTGGMLRKMNFFSEDFNMASVLEELQRHYKERKHLLSEVNHDVLATHKRREGLSKYEANLLHKQTQIILYMRNSYQSLNNVSYVKYHLPYCVQPKTNNTDICASKNGLQKNAKKKNILRELNVRKRLAEYKVAHFVKKYTGKIKGINIMHTQMAQLYEEKSTIEIFVKSGGDRNSFDLIVGHIVFFDYRANVLLENVVLVVREIGKGRNIIRHSPPAFFHFAKNVVS